MTPEAPQRIYPLREVFNGLRYAVRTGCPWRVLPHDLPPWDVVYYQAQRWLKAGVFEQLAQDLRAVLRLQAGRNTQPSAAIFDRRTLQSTPESGARAGYDGAKRRKGSKIHLAVDTLGHLLALHVTPAVQQDRAPGRAAGGSRATGHGRERRISLCRSGLCRRGSRASRPTARHPTGSGEVAGSQEGVCAAAPTLGGGAFLRLGFPVPASGARL